MIARTTPAIAQPDPPDDAGRTITASGEDARPMVNGVDAYTDSLKDGVLQDITLITGDVSSWGLYHETKKKLT